MPKGKREHYHVVCAKEQLIADTIMCSFAQRAQSCKYDSWLHATMIEERTQVLL